MGFAGFLATEYPAPISDFLYYRNQRACSRVPAGGAPARLTGYLEKNTRHQFRDTPPSGLLLRTRRGFGERALTHSVGQQP